MTSKHTYDHAEMQRYLEKQMTKTEMYAFEKALMDDPFLADAFEGFQKANNTTSIKHLAEIVSRIRDAKQDTRVVAMKFSKSFWIRIAALFILVIGAALVTYNILNPPAQSTLAKRESTQKNVENKAPIQEVDSIRVASPLPEANAPIDQPIALNTLRNSSPVVRQSNNDVSAASPKMEGAVTALSDSAIQDNPPMANATKAPATTDIESVNSARSMQMEKESGITSLRNFNGKVVDAKDQPVSAATILFQKDKGATARIDGSFNIKSPDTVLKVTVAMAGFGPVSATIKSGEENKIVLAQNNESLSEVAVTSMGKKRTRKAAATAAAKPVNTFEPKGGWTSFDSYIQAATDKAKADKEITTTGNVELEFTIDRSGKPANIIATQPTSTELEKKAIDILKSGPQWHSTSKHVKAKVTIRF
jgi:hypothetical protein